VDGIAGAGIASLVGLVVSHREAAETTDLNALALLQSLGHAIENLVDKKLRARPRELEFICDHRNEISLGHN